MDEGAPKPKKLDREAIEVQVVLEYKLELYRKLFNNLQEGGMVVMSPELKADYEEFVNLYTQMMREDPKRLFDIEDMKKRIPKNQWINLAQLIILTLGVESEPTEELKDKIRKSIEARAKGKDIN